MKNILRLFSVMFLASISTQSFAQPVFGVRGGMNFAKMVMKDDGGTYSEDFKMNFGYNIGATAEFAINEKYSFETGLLLSTKGLKVKYKDFDYEESTKMNLLYLDIPLTGKAYLNISGQKAFVLFGPYIGMGLTGKSKYTWEYDGDSGSESETIDFGSEGDLKSFDFGLTFGAGVEIKKFQIGLTYNIGLANISIYTSDGEKISNRVLAISGTYRF